MLFFSMFKNRFRERMFTFFLQGKCHGEKLLFGDSVCREQISNFRLAAGDRTGLVQGNNLNLAGLFERNGSFEQDTIPGSHSIADHDRYRSSKSEGTWATDNENGDTAGKSIAKFVSGQKPDDRSNDCNRNNCRNKNTGNAVCDFGDRSFGSGGITHHFDDLRECGIFADTGCFAFDKSGLVDGRGRNKISGCFVNRDTFTGKSRFIDGTGSLDDHAINRDIFARADHKDISLVDLFDRNGSFLVIAKNNGGLWGKLHEALESIGRFSLGTGFEHFSNSDQRQDHCGGLEIKFHHVVHNGSRITVYLCSCHGKKCVDTPYK